MNCYLETALQSTFFHIILYLVNEIQFNKKSKDKIDIKKLFRTMINSIITSIISLFLTKLFIKKFKSI